MAEGGKKLAAIKNQLVNFAAPGVALSQIEALAQKLISNSGGQASFALVPGYRFATCVNLNSGIVHGIPSATKITEGDLVSIDVGLYYQGFHTDTSVSFTATRQKNLYPDKLKFLAVGKKALKLAIAQAVPGHRVGHISKALEDTISAAGYSPATNLTGHGVGRQLHEAPAVPCFIDGPIELSPKLTVGMTLAIEAIYMAGPPDTVTDEADHWTIAPADGKLAAVFEDTVAITTTGPQILTEMV